MKHKHNYRYFARTIVVAMLGLTIGAAYLLQYLRFDYEFEDFFPKNDPDYAYYNEFRDSFGSDNDFILISLANDNGIFDKEYLLRVDSLTKQLKDAPFVERVVSPTTQGYPVVSPLGNVVEIHWIHPNDTDRYKTDAQRIFESGELVGNLIASDTHSVTVIAFTKMGLSKVKSDSAAKGITAVIDRFSFDQTYMAGRIFGQKYYVRKMQDELMLFTLISLVIVTLFLLFTFRSIWGVWVPLAVVGISVLWLLATMVLTGKSFDLLSILLPTILFVVGMSDVVHILSRYIEELRSELPKPEAIKITIRHVGFATLLTSITTAIGFLSLYVSPITPVREFGLYTAIGVMLAYLITILLLPPLMYLSPAPKISFVRNESLFWDKKMRALLVFNVRNKSKILVAFTGVVLVSLWGVSRVEVNNYLLEDLGKKDPLRQQFEFFEKHYSGARPFEVAITATDTQMLFSEGRILFMERAETYFAEQYKMKTFVSLVNVYKGLTRAINGGRLSEYRLPETEKEWRKVNKWVVKLFETGKLSSLVSDDGRSARISARVTDYGGKTFKKLNIASQKDLEGQLANHALTMRFTGMAYLIDKNNETLAANLMWGLLLAFLAVAVVMGLLFKSLRMVVITLIPNIIPLLAIGGVMGFMGIDLKVSTSIIFTVAFGIAVDDTIHYISKLKMELNKGRTLAYAVKRAGISTGKAIVITSLILISGFIALIFSDFSSTYYIGLLVSITLLFAVLTDIILLPVLVLIFYKPVNKKTFLNNF